MNQAYNQDFARVYNLLFVDFVRLLAPRVGEVFRGRRQVERSLLDVCCGTGQLALYFLERGFNVTGVDLSEPMIAYARQNTSAYRERAAFSVADAANFTIENPVGLAVSTFDALNHLPDS